MNKQVARLINNKVITNFMQQKHLLLLVVRESKNLIIEIFSLQQ